MKKVEIMAKLFEKIQLEMQPSDTFKSLIKELIVALSDADGIAEALKSTAEALTILEKRIEKLERKV